MQVCMQYKHAAVHTLARIHAYKYCILLCVVAAYNEETTTGPSILKVADQVGCTPVQNYRVCNDSFSKSITAYGSIEVSMNLGFVCVFFFILFRILDF